MRDYSKLFKGAKERLGIWDVLEKQDRAKDREVEAILVSGIDTWKDAKSSPEMADQLVDCIYKALKRVREN